VSAARAVFTSSGYEAATIESVASAARVSAPTVYALFRSKAGLLSAVVADGGSDSDIRELAGKALGETDPRRRIAGAARVVREIMERERGILGVLRQAGTAREELGAARRQVHQQQRDALGRVLRPLHDAGVLRAGMRFDEAVATFAALASPESFWLLVDEQGWSPTRWGRWLADSASRLLLD
jgi:TetR/AcrR family transcriptional regulator, regulator of cefoperazone and chloramphenicol sensitivity